MVMAAEEGVFAATPRSAELLSVVRRYGDGAMDFIRRNKGSLTVTALLGKFLMEPEAYISGAKQLVVDPVLAPIARNANWTWIIAGVLLVAFLLVMAGQLRRMERRRSA